MVALFSQYFLTSSMSAQASFSQVLADANMATLVRLCNLIAPEKRVPMWTNEVVESLVGL